MIRRTHAAGLLAALMLAGSSIGMGASAQVTGAGKGNDEPVRISAENGVEWRQQEQFYRASGNAIATRGNSSIRADVLTAHYKKGPNDKNQIWKVVGAGNVLITSGEDRITGQQAVYLVEPGVFTITGHNLKIENPKRTITARDRIEYRQKEQIAHVVGNAKAVEGKRTVSADRFVAHFKKGADGKTEMSKVDALGNVVIITEKEVVRGDRGDFDNETRIATLTGNVRVTSGDNQLNGAKAIVNMKTGVSRLVADKNERINVLIKPGEDGGGLDIPVPGNDNKGGTSKNGAKN
jgi:lipopolysaccharide export system protein LptA